ncbi:MAG: hypothetical protein A2W20_06035 [Candidatus Aminicenantes bacterium RBG_16_66_30]|nr:MAG: hypothetical protein A2W20_06035 [Candidatus Aminicenantes bacterium RBG_16_66_30]
MASTGLGAKDVYIQFEVSWRAGLAAWTASIQRARYRSKARRWNVFHSSQRGSERSLGASAYPVSCFQAARARGE